MATAEPRKMYLEADALKSPPPTGRDPRGLVFVRGVERAVAFPGNYQDTATVVLLQIRAEFVTGVRSAPGDRVFVCDADGESLLTLSDWLPYQDRHRGFLHGLRGAHVACAWRS